MCKAMEDMRNQALQEGLAAGRKEGIQEGIKKGIQKGKKEGRKEIALRMLEMGKYTFDAI